MTTYYPIAESNNFIVLDKYKKEWKVAENFQSEGDLERELIQDLSNQGYEYLPNVTTLDSMLVNLRKQLQALNKIEFTDAEWVRFQEQYLNTPSDSIIDKTRKFGVADKTVSSTSEAMNRQKTVTGFTGFGYSVFVNP